MDLLGYKEVSAFFFMNLFLLDVMIHILFWLFENEDDVRRLRVRKVKVRCDVSAALRDISIQEWRELLN